MIDRSAPLTEDERLREIAGLLAAGAIRFLRKQTMAGGRACVVPTANGKEVWELVDDEAEQQILRYLEQEVSASPVRIGAALALSHMTLTRRLVRLRRAGLVTVSGKTRSARYALASTSHSN